MPTERGAAMVDEISVAKDMGDPSEDHPGLFGWVRPVLSVSDSMMVRTVGLDAVVVSRASLQVRVPVSGLIGTRTNSYWTL
jgi:hypothetical protein